MSGGRGSADPSKIEEYPLPHEELVAQLFRQHRRALHSYLSRILSSSSEADEIVQDAYLRLLNFETLDPVHGNARALLFKIATNLARDRLRQRKTRLPGATKLDLTHDPDDDSLGPDRIIDRQIGMQVVKGVLLDLGNRQREAFLLHVVEQLSYREIARKMGVSTKTIERDMALILELCQSRLRILDEARTNDA
jgi:RNA polymerase sigma-70 factor (ECF subfamily)